MVPWPVEHEDTLLQDLLERPLALLGRGHKGRYFKSYQGAL